MQLDVGHSCHCCGPAYTVKTSGYQCMAKDGMEAQKCWQVVCLTVLGIAGRRKQLT